MDIEALRASLDSGLNEDRRIAALNYHDDKGYFFVRIEPEPPVLNQKGEGVGACFALNVAELDAMASEDLVGFYLKAAERALQDEIARVAQ